MKDSGIRIRVERDLRDKFLSLCRRKDRPAAQVLREFMREYIAAHEFEENHKSSLLPPIRKAAKIKKRKKNTN